jgi:predicted transposase YdaD
VIAAILVARFSGRTVPEICAMGGITAYDYTSSVVYREIFGLGLQEGQQKGRQEGRQKGRQAEAAALTLRQLQRRCGSLQPNQQALFQGLPSAISKTWPTPCSISRGRQTSRPG